MSCLNKIEHQYLYTRHPTNIPPQVILQIQIILTIAVLYRQHQIMILFMLPNILLVSLTIQSIIT
jgi:hypothetical protein